MVTICTASLTFNNSTFCPHSVFMCFVWISEQTAIISLYSITCLFVQAKSCNFLILKFGGSCALEGTVYIRGYGVPQTVRCALPTSRCIFHFQPTYFVLRNFQIRFCCEQLHVQVWLEVIRCSWWNGIKSVRSIATFLPFHLSACCWAASLRHVVSKFTCPNPSTVLSRPCLWMCVCVCLPACSPLKSPCSVMFYFVSVCIRHVFVLVDVLINILAFVLPAFRSCCVTPTVAVYVRRVVCLCSVQIPI